MKLYVYTRVLIICYIYTQDYRIVIKKGIIYHIDKRGFVLSTWLECILLLIVYVRLLWSHDADYSNGLYILSYGDSEGYENQAGRVWFKYFRFSIFEDRGTCWGRAPSCPSTFSRKENNGWIIYANRHIIMW